MDTRELAKKVRIDIVTMAHDSGASHVAAALSIADIVSVLYGKVMKYTVEGYNPKTQDVMVLSKGHSGMALYAALAETGFFDKELLKNYYTYGSLLSGHVSHKVPGVSVSTGSLGHGVCIATGMAMAKKMNKSPSHVYAVCGDGELNEGSVWEAIMFCHKQDLSNFTIIVDRNGLQALGPDVMDMGDLVSKFESFGLEVISVDGHDHTALESALTKPQTRTRVIIAKTTKGKGVSFMENKVLWHYRNPNDEDLEIALKELEAAR